MEGQGALTLLSVAERFVSINGEGTHAGRLSAFIRLAGCNLSCAYCDTAWARSEDAASEVLSAADLASWVQETGVACVTITGGEPLAQPGLPALAEALLSLPPLGLGEGRFIEVETNGACDLGPLAALRSAVLGPHELAFTVDCKLSCAGAEAAARMLPSNYALLEAGDAVKFVCGSEADLAEALIVIERHGLAGRCKVLLSPVSGRLDPAVIVDFMKRQGMAYATLQLQLHKVIWGAEAQGV